MAEPRGDVPGVRRLLRHQHGHLAKVADYCESSYVQASDKRKALEETMAYSTQSLASVTYQISSLASSFLELLELQAAALRRVEADVNCVAQLVDMHKEKVARREVGSLTVPRRFPNAQKVVSPASPPSLEPYYRKPLNFSILDDIGHGIKDRSTQLSRTGTLSRKGTKATAAGTLGRGPRIPEPVQPPVVPEEKLSAASSSSSSSLASTSSSGAPGLAGDSVPAPPPLPASPGPPALGPATVPPPPPPLPGDLPLLGDLDLPPPGDLDLTLPPPGDLPLLGDLPLPGDLPPPPPGDLDLPPLGDLDLPTAAELPPPLPGDLPLLEDLPPPPPGDLPSPGELPPPPLGDLELPPASPQLENPAASEEPPWAPQSYLQKVRSLYPYERRSDNELSFAAGALLYVTRRYSDGWCEGVAGGQAGFFPGNYVEPFC